MNSTCMPDHPEPEDSDLMLRTAAGDMAAFETIVRRHQQKLMNFFVRMGVNTGRAEELVQDTLLRVFRNSGRYRASARFTTFLYTIARNALIDELRRNQREEDAIAEETARLNAGHDCGLAGMQARMDVRSALSKLPPKLREPVILSVYQGMRYEEIADVLKIPLGTVKSRIFLAMRALRNLLDENTKT